MGQGATLPAGYRALAFERLDSTNAEAMRRAAAGEPAGLWVWSLIQSEGRGRAGRGWDSPAGNLHASVLLRPRCNVETALQLAFVAGLTVHDLVRALLPEGAPRPSLKWPNDVLIDDRKVSGVLLESAAGADAGECVVVVGFGVNLARHPTDALRPATDVARHGANVPPRLAFQHLTGALHGRLVQWNEGAGFDAIRGYWEERALPVGHRIRVRLQDREEHGRYGGIDASGALRLVVGSGAERRIAAGDVFAV